MGSLDYELKPPKVSLSFGGFEHLLQSLEDDWYIPQMLFVLAMMPTPS